MRDRSTQTVALLCCLAVGGSTAACGRTPLSPVTRVGAHVNADGSCDVERMVVDTTFNADGTPHRAYGIGIDLHYPKGSAECLALGGQP